MDLENDHYEGLKIYNDKIWELRKLLELSDKKGRKIENAGSGISKEDRREMLRLKNRLRRMEEEFNIASGKLKSEREDRVELENVYNEEKRNGEKLRDELKKMDGEMIRTREETKELQAKLKHLEEMSEDKREEMEGGELRRLRMALDGKINELRNFKEGYSNSKREHEKEKKRLRHRVEELEKSIQQGKKEDRIEELEDLKKKNEELARWVDYVEEDLDNIIFKIEKIEDDMNMKIGSAADLKEETETLARSMKNKLRKYCMSTTTEDNDGLEDKKSRKEVKEEGGQKNEALKGETNTQETFWRCGEDWFGNDW